MPILTKDIQHLEVGYLYEHIHAIRARSELFTQKFLPDIDYWVNFETLWDGKVLAHFVATDEAAHIIQQSLDATDQAISAGQIDIDFALAHFAAEYKAELKFDRSMLLRVLQSMANAAWEPYDIQQVLLPKAGKKYEEAQGDDVLHIHKIPTNFKQITIDFYLNDDAYTEYPATIFV